MSGRGNKRREGNMRRRKMRGRRENKERRGRMRNEKGGIIERNLRK